MRDIGRDLKVRTVLTGKLTQRANRIVVQTELVDVENDAQVWGGQFNRESEDIFELQEQLARQITEKLRVRLTPDDKKRLGKRFTQNREAYELLLRAGYHLTKWSAEGFQRGMAYAKQAVEVDPAYAEAYAWLSAAYSALAIFGLLSPLDAFPKAKVAAEKALEIDNSLGEAQVPLAMVRLYYEWDWSGAELALSRALEVSPNFAWCHVTRSDWLFVMRRYEEGIAELQVAVDLDPLSASIIVKLAQRLYWRGEYKWALESLHEALELDSTSVFVHAYLAQAYAGLGAYAESFAACETLSRLYAGNPYSLAVRSLVLAMAGKADAAMSIVSALKREPRTDSLSLTYLAEACSVMGKKDEAFAFLEMAYRERATMLIFIGVKPTFDNIRSDPRFTELLRRMGLAQFSISTPC